MSTVAIKVGGTDYAPSVIFREARFESKVNGAVGEGVLKVRDEQSSLSFTPGAVVELIVDGVRQWQGFVTRVAIAYAFPASGTLPMRLWILRCVDINILFQRRIVFNQADPDNTYGTLFPPGTDDSVAIADLVANFLDLTGDGIDTSSLVETVGELDPEQDARPWSAGMTWAQTMASIAMVPVAIFYLDADRNLVYTDIDTPNAPFGLSDQPNGVTTKGYREMEILLDGSNLATDVLAWGFGYGSQVPVFTRIDGNLATHGRWQVGVSKYGVYKQGTIDRIADSILNGSPNNRRGQKDDREAVKLVTYEAGLRPAQKVTFTSEAFGYEKVLPIRRMTITFPAPDKPRFELGLSIDTDAPWSFIDNLLFRYPRFGLPRLPGFPGWPVPPDPCGITDTFNRPYRYYQRDAGGIFRYAEGESPVDVSADPTATYSFGTASSGLTWTTSASPTNVGSYQGIEDLRAVNHGVTAGSWNQRMAIPVTEPFDATIVCQMAKYGVDANMNFYMRFRADNEQGAAGQVTVRAMGYTGEAGEVQLAGFGGIFEVAANPLSGRSDTVAKDFMIRLRREVSGSDQDVRCKVWWADEPEPSSWLLVGAGTGLSAGQAAPVNGVEVNGDHASGGGTPPYGVHWEFEDLDIAGVNACTVSLVLDNYEGRTEAGGWGTASSGYAWNVFAPADNALVLVEDGYGSVGPLDISPPPPPIITAGYFNLSDASGPWNLAVGCTVTVTFEVTRVPTGSESWLDIGIFGDAGGAAGGVRVHDGTDGEVFVGSSAAAKSDWAADTLYKFKMEYRPDLGTQKIRVWLAADPEPTTWDVEQGSGAPTSWGDDFIVALEAIFNDGLASDARMKIHLIELLGGGTGGGGGQAFPPMGPGGFGCQAGVRVSSTQYRTNTAFIPRTTVVYVDGRLQRPGTDYDEESDSQTLTFAGSIASSSTVRICYFAAVVPS